MGKFVASSVVAFVVAVGNKIVSTKEHMLDCIEGIEDKLVVASSQAFVVVVAVGNKIVNKKEHMLDCIEDIVDKQVVA